MLCMHSTFLYTILQTVEEYLLLSRLKQCCVTINNNNSIMHWILELSLLKIMSEIEIREQK